MHQAYFFVHPKTKRIPARDYLEGLDERSRGRFEQFLAYLQEHGALPFPYASHIQGALREIRIRVARDRHRILYALVEGRRIILLLGFTKRTEKTPRALVTKAESYLTLYYSHKLISTYEKEN